MKQNITIPSFKLIVRIYDHDGDLLRTVIKKNQILLPEPGDVISFPPGKNTDCIDGVRSMKEAWFKHLKNDELEVWIDAVKL